MPYITKTEREACAENPLYGQGNPGILNYRITQIISAWLPRDFRYADLDAAIGALECAKFELYRRIVADYEDEAIERNGDVYPPKLLKGKDASHNVPPLDKIEVNDEVIAEEVPTAHGGSTRRYL